MARSPEQPGRQGQRRQRPEHGDRLAAVEQRPTALAVPQCLHPDHLGHEREAQAPAQPHQRRDPAGVEPQAMLPPAIQQDHHRIHHDGGLREHRQQEEEHRPRIVAGGMRRASSLDARRLPLASDGIVELHKRDRRQQKQRLRERVFEFRHPADGFHADRVDREEKATEPRTGQLHDMQQSPEGQRAEDVKDDVDDVVAGRVHPEGMPLEPEPCCSQREVISAGRDDPEVVERPRRLRYRVCGD